MAGVVTHLPKETWSPKTVTDFIVSCRLQRGVPIFRTRFAGFPYETVEKESAVVAVCWGGTGPEISKAFVDLPIGMTALLEKDKGDWDWLLAFYGGREWRYPRRLYRR